MISRYGLPLIVATFVLLASAYSVVVPLGEAPDEVPHFSYVQYLVLHRQLPPPEGAVAGESRQPPLYYLIGAIATAWVSPRDFQVIANPDFVLDDSRAPLNSLLHTRQEAFPYRSGALVWHIVRALTVVMGAVTVWATWHTGQKIFPDDPWIALCAASFVAFLPEFAFLSAVVNNDNLVIMLSSLVILQVLRMRESHTWRDAAALGVLLGLSVLAKWSGFVLWAFAFGMLGYWALEVRQWKENARLASFAFLIALVIVAPWALDNLKKYGDPIGWSLALAVTDARQMPMMLGDWAFNLRGLFTSFFGRFGGSLSINSPSIVYALLSASVLLGLLGWIWRARDARDHVSNANMRLILISFLLFWFLLLAAYMRWTLTFLGTDAGRLIFPGLPLLAVFLAVGIARLFRSFERIAVSVWVGVFFFSALGVLLYLRAIYAISPLDPRTLPRLAGANAPADFGQTIRVTDYRIEQTQVAQSEPVWVEIYWQALIDPPENYWLLLQLSGNEGVVVNQDGVPTAGRLTTDRWQAGQSYSSRHKFNLPNDFVPDTYMIRLGLHPFGRWDWLSVRGQEMLTLGGVTIVSGK